MIKQKNKKNSNHRPHDPQPPAAPDGCKNKSQRRGKEEGGDEIPVAGLQPFGLSAGVECSSRILRAQIDIYAVHRGPDLAAEKRGWRTENALGPLLVRACSIAQTEQSWGRERRKGSKKKKLPPRSHSFCCLCFCGKQACPGHWPLRQAASSCPGPPLPPPKKIKKKNQKKNPPPFTRARLPG